MMKQQIKALFLASFAISMFVELLANPGSPGASAASGLPFPRLGNYYLGDIPDPTTLARWDVVIVQAGSAWAASYPAIRAANPQVKIIPYVASEETTVQLDAPQPWDPATGFSPLWNLQRADGSLITGWFSNQIYDASAVAPVVNGQRWVDHLAAWTIAHLHNIGRGDGIYYDNVYSAVDWLDAQIDTDRNFRADISEPGKGVGWLNSNWVAGMEALMSQTRAGFGPNAVIISGGTSGSVNTWANGSLNEGFAHWIIKYQAADWNANFHDYLDWSNSHYGDNYYIVNQSGNQTDYQTMRFYLGTTLLSDGYSSYDGPNGGHDVLYWYDEYSVDLASGRATGDASHKGYLGFPHGAATQLPNGLWKRVYDNGIVLVNPTGASLVQDLGGSYRLIKGSQDAATNTGATVSGLNLASRDARILLNLTGSPPTATPTNTPVKQPTTTSTSTTRPAPSATTTPTSTTRPAPSATTTSTSTTTPAPSATTTPTSTTTPAGSVNLALGMPATASSIDNASNQPSNAFDGSMATRWSSAYSDAQWLEVDLGTRQQITGAVLAWELAYGKAYNIQVSNTGRYWHTVYSQTNGSGGTETLAFNATGRYVRLLGIARGTQWGYSLWELQVLGPGSTPRPGPPAQ